MADLDKVKRNVAKMVGQNAPEQDIDSYLSSEGVTVDQVKAHKLSAAPAASEPPPQAKPSTYADIVKSAASGLGQGVAAVAGLPGDIGKAVQYVGDKIQGYFDPETLKKMQAARQNMPANVVPAPPSSADINRGIQSVTGQYHEPQTTAGDYARTIASFAPAAIAPGGTIARAARVVVPGAASETAGQATKGTQLEPYARTIGALAGGAVQGVGEAALTANRPTPGVPTTSELKQAAHGQYAKADNAGLIVKGDSMKGMATDLGATLANEGMDATLHPKATAVYKNINNANDNTTLKGIDILRQQAGDAAGSLDPAERRLGRIIKDHIDDFVGNLKPEDVVQGDAQGAADSITNARDLWSRASKGEIIDNAIQKAKNSASMFTGSGLENSLRTRFRQLSNNDRVMRRFSPDEQDAIQQVASGTAIGNALRFLGKFSPHGYLNTMMTGGAGYELGGPVGAAAALGAGELGRVGATAITTKNARLASELVRQGPPRSISQAALGRQPQNTTAQTLSVLAAQPEVQKTPTQ